MELKKETSSAPLKQGHAAYMRRYRQTAYGKYQKHKEHAGERGIPFLFTFEEWCNEWLQSGHWQERGTCGTCYVMARHGDVGPYAVGNVRITTATENILEGRHFRGVESPRAKLNDEAVIKIRADLAAGKKMKRLAEEHGVSYWTIRDIKDGVTWRHVH